MSISSQQVEPQLPKTTTHSRENSHDLESPSHKKPTVRYRECLKNHAATMGGNATDGCGEFMPSGEEGTIEAFKCSACNCHRNFHRKETEPEFSHNFCLPQLHSHAERRMSLGHYNKLPVGPNSMEYPSATVTSSRMIFSYKVEPNPSELVDKEEKGGDDHRKVKKRFRTKFTQEQKEKMLMFAEKAGWRIQKQEESVVQQLCQEIGIRRRVLKVWMHNNKHSLAKKNPSTD